MSSLKICLLLVLSLFSISVRASKVHNNQDPILLDLNEEFLPEPSRLLATQTYPQLRMTADYSNVIQGTADFKNYVQSELLPPVLDYFQAALQVKQPLTTPLKVSSTVKTLCGYSTPSALWTGVNTDFFVIVSSTSDNSSNWVASAGSCVLSSGTKRPTIATMLFNLYYTKDPLGDPLIHEKNMYLTLHEMLHALGFTGSSFQNFIDASGVTLKGHLKTVLLDGTNRTVLDVEPLTSRLRTHYGCSTLPGAFLEDDGGSGTAGSHFERRHFLYEVMTSGVIQGLRISEFSLAVMEGSGWYMPNYTYADPFFVGKGQGCGFLYTSCSNTSVFTYDEFCPTTNVRACGFVGVAGGVCSSDSRSDGCQYNIPVIEFHCESPAASDNARFPTREVYSRTGGSRCFNGNLTTLTKSTQTTFCFTYTCSGSGLTTQLTVNVGTTIATCKAEGPLKVSGLNGQLNCPDPLTFCSTTGKKTCPRQCMGRGKCVNNACVCNTGYTGIDCAMNV